MSADQGRRFPRSAFLLGIAGTILYHSSQFFSGFDKFFGDRGDVRGFVYFMEHWYLSILGKASLFNPGIFYPTKRTLAYSDLLFGFAAPYSFYRARARRYQSKAQRAVQQNKRRAESEKC